MVTFNHLVAPRGALCCGWTRSHLPFCFLLPARLPRWEVQFFCGSKKSCVVYHLVFYFNNHGRTQVYIGYCSQLLGGTKGAIVVLGEVATHHLHLTQTLRRASEQRSHLVFLFSLLPVLFTRRARSSDTFFFLNSTSSIMGCCCCCSAGDCGTEVGSTVEIRGTFFALSCFPPSSQKDASFFS